MSNKVYNASLYNEKVKLKFLELMSNSGQSENTLIAYRRVLLRASAIEQRFDTDLYDFKFDQIERLLIKMNHTTLNSATSSINIIRNYIKWAIQNKYTKTSLSPLDVFTTRELAERYKNKRAKVYFTRDEVALFAKSAVNAQDKALIWAIFYGISGTSMSELRNLTIDDIDEQSYRLTLRGDDSERVIELISDEQKELISYLIKAHEQTHYLKGNGKSSAKNPVGFLARNNHVFRPMIRGASSTASYHVLRNRLVDIAKINEEPQLTSPISLRYSGMLYMAYQEYKKHGTLNAKSIKKISQFYDVNKISENKYDSFFLRTDFLNEETIMKEYLYENKGEDHGANAKIF
ncbi:hypothetical protein TCA2_5983 [Paenibacillus sp. TCA20]|uniref:phage lytic cycle repressor MrpR family protein n=1 Tax=Paenibacillus sp. TCA20 TaxID=1499968 RepID=UPI0004D86768|nr:hypothetical protein [Paenibacillus sp. TCA20]GAK43485.1 hypothetical protein TCA2_5983 [Paenibacillus sp. TCA20]